MSTQQPPGPYFSQPPAGWPAPPANPYQDLPATLTKPDPLPSAGTEYHQFFRTGRNRWWKGVVVIVLLVIGYLIVSTVTAIAAISVDAATGRISPEALRSGELVVTPLVLLAINLSAASLIPISMLLQWGFYGQPVRFLHSVRGYFRWDVFRRMALIIVPIFAVYVLATVLLGQSPLGPFTAESAALLAVVLLTTPLQSAGEEYGARGLINRAAGSWAADPRIALGIGAAVSSTLFMLAHGAGDPWLIAYYFYFGVAMSVVVWRTGGLEVSTLIHTANNLLLFVVAILLGQDLAGGFDRSDGAGGPWMLIPMVLLTIVTAVVWWWARRRQPARRYQLG